jgi:hypothetical protein
MLASSRVLVDVSPLKRWAFRNLHTAPRLRQLILTDADAMGVEEFLVKIEVWGRLLDAETRCGSSRVHDDPYGYNGWTAAPQIGSEGKQFVW